MGTENTTLDDICAEIGYSATNIIVAWFGGDYVRVPESVSPENPISRAIGMSAMKRFVVAWGGQRLWIPAAHQFSVEQRDRVIVDLLVSGMSHSEIGRQIGLSERRVQQLRVRLEKDGMLLLGKKLEGKDATQSALAKITWKRPQEKQGAKMGGKNGGQKPPYKVPRESVVPQSALGRDLAGAMGLLARPAPGGDDPSDLGDAGDRRDGGAV
jgi:hypothetical protein